MTAVLVACRGCGARIYRVYAEPWYCGGDQCVSPRETSPQNDADQSDTLGAKEHS